MFWYNDYGRTERRLFLDGRKHPTEPTPTGEFGRTYSGHSIGHWEGNTLVVETVGMFGGYFDETPAPFSDQISMVERMRLIDTNILEIRMTLTDPVPFEKPWVVTRYFRRGPRQRPPAAVATSAAVPASDQITRGTFINLNDRPCVPNVRMDENGFQVTILPQELEARTQPCPRAKNRQTLNRIPKKARRNREEGFAAIYICVHHGFCRTRPRPSFGRDPCPIFVSF
jgi:hypothetical protein